MRNQDRFRGCLIGGAAGDALGYAVEFKEEQDIFSRYGKCGITEYALHDGKALISDDTQMTLFTATGLLVETTRRLVDEETNDYFVEIRNSCLDWLKTQGECARFRHGRCSSWLVNVPELHSRRDPGGTCLHALESGNVGTIGESINQSKGSGGVMRVAPIGLYFNNTDLTVEQIARIGADAAAITHGHILGWLPAAVLVQIIHEISQNDASVRDAVMKTFQTQEEMWPASHHKDDFLTLMRKAVELAETDINDLEAIHQLGEGWTADECLAIAVYCASRYEDDFEKGIIAAANHDGDSDTTGAVCGNILGARLGLQGIPEKFITNLELKDMILEIADDLYKDCPLNRYDLYNGDPVWVSKYIDMTWPKKEVNDPNAE